MPRRGNETFWDTTCGGACRDGVCNQGHAQRINAIRLSHSCKEVYTIAQDGRVKGWECESGRLLFSQDTDVQALCMDLDENDNHLVVGFNDGSVVGYDSRTGEELEVFQAADSQPITAVTVEKNIVGTTRVYFGAENGKVRMWDWKAKSIFYFRNHVRVLKTRELKITALVLVDDILVASSMDWVVRAWSTGTGQRLKADAGHQREVTNMVVLFGSTHADDIVVTGSNDCTMIAWKFSAPPKSKSDVVGSPARRGSIHQATRRMVKLHVFQADDPITKLAAVDKDRFAAAYNSGTVDVWTTRFRGGSGLQLRFLHHNQPITSLMSSYSKSLQVHKLYAGSYKLVLMWKLAVEFKDDAPVKFAGHNSFVSDMAIAADDNLLLTASFDGTARTWDDVQHTAKVHLRSATLPDFATPTLHFMVMIMQMTSFPLSRNFPWSKVAAPAQIAFDAGIFQFQFDITVDLFEVQYWAAIGFIGVAFILFALRDYLFVVQFAAKNTVSSAGQSYKERQIMRIQRMMMLWVYAASMSLYLPATRTMMTAFDCTDIGGTRVWDRALVDINPAIVVNATVGLGVLPDSVLEYECLGPNHLPFFLVSAVITIPYLLFALRLAIVRGAVRAVVKWRQPKFDAGRGVAEYCWMGALTRRRNSRIVDITVLIANTILSMVSILLTSSAVVLSWAYLICSMAVATVTIVRRPYYGKRANFAMFCGRFLFFWTCLMGVVTAQLNDPTNDIPAWMLWIGYIAVSGAFLLFVVGVEIWVKCCKKNRHPIHRSAGKRRVELRAVATEITKTASIVKTFSTNAMSAGASKRQLDTAASGRAGSMGAAGAAGAALAGVPYDSVHTTEFVPGDTHSEVSIGSLADVVLESDSASD